MSGIDVTATLRRVLLVLALAAAPQASAQGLLPLPPTDGEAAVRALVAAIDDSPDWSASFRDLTVDPATGAVVVSGLTVRSAGPGLTIGFDTIWLDGFRAAEGGFAADRVAANGGAVSAGPFAVGLSDVALDGVRMPGSGGFVFDAANPLAWMATAAAQLDATGIAGGRIGELTLTEEIDGVVSRVSYNGVAFDSWAGGRVGKVSAGPLMLQSPGELPLVTMTVARAEASDLDLGAFLGLHPVAAAGGGDGEWRTALGAADYGAAVIAIPGAKLTVGAVSIGDVKVRRPVAGVRPDAEASGSSVAGDLRAAAERALQVTSAYSIGRFALGPVDFEAVGFDRVHLDRLSTSDLSLDGVGELAIEGLAGAVAGEAGLKIDRLALRGLRFPPAERIAAAIRTGVSGGDVDFSGLAPRLASLEASGVDAAIGTLPPARLGKLTIDLGHYVGNVATSVTVDMTGADVATSMIPDGRARRLLESFGYDRVTVDLSAKVAWNETEEATAVSDLRVAIAEIGTLTGEATFAGPTRAEIESLAQASGMAERLALTRGTFTFEDDSLVGRALTRQAERLKVDPAKFREQFARGLPFMLAFLGNRDFQTKVAPVLQAFIRAPGALTVIAAPATPVAVSAIIEALATAPFSLPDLLALTVTGEAGAPAEPSAETPPKIETVE